jgi:P-type Ca2+ transporter type 2C
LIVAVTIIVVAVPEGLPLAVTLALAFATKRMTKDHNLVRHLQSCETMGNATVICTDKTGTLTENVMTIVGGNLGASQISFSDSNMSSRLAAMAKEMLENGDIDSETSSPTNPEFSEPPSEPTNRSQNQVSVSELSEALSSETRALLKESVAINSTAFEGEEDGKPAFIGSKTETALLDWAKNYLGLGTLNLERANLPVVQLFPFDSGKKCMAAVVKKDDKTWRMFLKGAPEIVIAHCKQVVENPAGKLNGVPLSQEQSSEIKSVISTYASLSLRTIALAYRDFDSWPPKNCRRQPDDPKMTEFDEVFGDLTWISVLGIQDPVRNGVSKAIEDCQRAGVRVIMVTGDNIETARAIAKETGILVGEDTAETTMEGPQFRQVNDFERQHKIEKLCVLARSSPEDKEILVKTLRSQGHVVAVTGDGTNDAQALKAADVGFSMGIAGTEVAKEASDIILMDDNFSSIVKALAWGRTVNDAVKKFLQFQITVNITAVILTFVTAVSSPNETSVLNAVQLLWVNLIMDTFAALALATDPPSWSLLDRKPEPRNRPLIDLTMWKMITGQAILQLVATFILYFAGPKFLHYDTVHQSTLVFNAFVWMQIFNALNCRRIDNHLNILEGIYKNWLFMGILGIMIGGQLLIVFVGGAAFVVKPLTGAQWGISIVIGLLSLPAGALIRCIPDSAIRSAIESVVPTWLLERHRQKTAPPSEEQYLWTARVNDIRDDLAFFRRVHGGRLSEIKYNITHPKHALERSRSSRSGSRSPMHSAIAMSGSLAGSIGVGDMSPIERPQTSFDRGNSSSGDTGHIV